jgi:hypothetical protein
MQQSRVIEINGIFLGAAISRRGEPGWQVVAADSRVVPAEGRITATIGDAIALARQAFWAAGPKRSWTKP